MFNTKPYNLVKLLNFKNKQLSYSGRKDKSPKKIRKLGPLQLACQNVEDQYPQMLSQRNSIKRRAQVQTQELFLEKTTC